MTHTSGRRERKRQQTIDRLAETAWLLFEKRGFEQVTMETIAAEADVAKGTLYKHFPTKEALLQQQFHNQLQAQQADILARLKLISGTRNQLRALFSFIADWAERRRHYLPHYLHFRMSSAEGGRRSGTDRLFAWLIEAGMERGELRRDLSPETGAHYLNFLFLSVLMRWLDQPDLNLNDEFEQMLTLYLDGLGDES
jgi:AcrR family transcriptional regulator